MENAIRPSAMGGWKGTIAISAVFFACAVFELGWGNGNTGMAFFLASTGHAGWGIQEKLHLDGKVISK